MEKPPAIEETREYLLNVQPLGIGSSGNVEITDIDPKPWSGHFNYLVRDGEKRAVLRLKGPEWGEPTQGIIDEYKNLKAVESYNVAPKPLLLDTDNFREPVLFEEYLEGTIFTALSATRQKALWPDVVDLIVRVNSVPVEESPAVFQETIDDYRRHGEKWDKRLERVAQCELCREWHERVIEILPSAKKLLTKFQPRLERVIGFAGHSFIFESAHAGHVLVTKTGLRFLNWEQVSRGDPSYMLAVFLAGFVDQEYFSEAKGVFIEHYLAQRPIPEFRELVEQRIAEREISNLIWVLWAYAERKDTRLVEEATDIERRYERVKEILAQNS